MSDDYEEIWLQQDCCADYAGAGRLWCQDDVFTGECDDGAEPTRYVRADLYESVLAEYSALKDLVEASGGLKCRSCDDVGWYPVQVADYEWELCQCEFCYCVDDSIFNRKAAAAKNAVSGRQEPSAGGFGAGERTGETDYG